MTDLEMDAWDAQSTGSTTTTCVKPNSTYTTPHHNPTTQMSPTMTRITLEADLVEVAIQLACGPGDQLILLNGVVVGLRSLRPATHGPKSSGESSPLPGPIPSPRPLASAPPQLPTSAPPNPAGIISIIAHNIKSMSVIEIGDALGYARSDGHNRHVIATIARRLVKEGTLQFDYSRSRAKPSFDLAKSKGARDNPQTKTIKSLKPSKEVTPEDLPLNLLDSI